MLRISYLLLIFCSFSYSTPLHLAAYLGRVKIVKLLLLCNAAVDARDREYCPYHCIVDKNALLIF